MDALIELWGLTVLSNKAVGHIGDSPQKVPQKVECRQKTVPTELTIQLRELEKTQKHQTHGNFKQLV